MIGDLTLALRSLARRPGYALGVMLTLALGIGMNTAAFGVVDALLFEPPPVREPDRLVRVFRHSPSAALSFGPASWDDLEAIRQQSGSLSASAAFTQALLALESSGVPHLGIGELVSGDYFAVLGVEAERGRVFDDSEASHPLAVLGHRAWKHRFGGDERLLGGSVLVNGHLFTVIGILPESFHGLTRGVSPEVWIPRASVRWSEAGSPWVVARLAPGHTLDDARAELELIARRSARLEPNAPESDLVALPAAEVRILPQLDGALGDGALLLMALVGVVLLLTVVNVSHLTLVRGIERRRELATRAALGGGRWALSRLLVVEALVLALAGGTLGAGLAAVLIGASARLRPPIPVVDVVVDPALDLRVLGVTLAISVLAALAIAPARFAARLDILRELAGGPALTGSRGRGRIFVPLQVALSLVLLSAAGLCLRSLRNAGTLDPGFRSGEVVVATMSPGLQGYSPERADGFFESLLTRLRARPDVVAAGFASHLPLSFEWHEDRVTAEGRPTADALTVGAAGVGPGYFESMGIAVRRGRAFESSDGASGPGVALVNETLAQRLWPATEAVGRRLRVAGAEDALVEVVGVVGDGRYRTLGEAPRGFLYRPLAQGGASGADAFVRSGTRTIVVRVTTPPEAFTGELRGELRALEPNLALIRLEPLDDALGGVLWVPRVAAGVFGSFGLLALALAVTGIYGVLSFAVTLRRRELGIRMALGARPSDLRRLVVQQALALVLTGVGLGLASSFAVTRLLVVALYGVSPTDPLTFALVSALLVGVACLAAERPARRAAGGALLVSLRGD